MDISGWTFKWGSAKSLDFQIDGKDQGQGKSVVQENYKALQEKLYTLNLQIIIMHHKTKSGTVKN